MNNKDATAGCGSPQRRHFLQTTALAGVSAAVLPALAGAREATPSCAPETEVKAFELDELTIADLQAGMASGKFSARSITEKYLARIDDDRQARARQSTA